MIAFHLMPFLAGIVFIATRLGGLFLFAPFLGSMVIPARIKAALVFALSLLLYPVEQPKFAAINLDNWPTICAGELIVGIAIGIATQLIFDAVEMAGGVLSVQMGYSLITILDPNTQANTTVVSAFYQALVLLIFLRLNVHMWLLRALGDSFGYLPPGSAHLGSGFVWTLLNDAAAVFTVGIEIAAPVLAATMLADLVLGLLGKASPQLPVMTLGPPVKSMLGILVLIGSLKYWPTMFDGWFRSSIVLAQRLLHLAA